MEIIDIVAGNIYKKVKGYLCSHLEQEEIPQQN
jgi:hypothetical protein